MLDDKFPQADNSATGKEARLAKLLDVKRKRELQAVFLSFFSLDQEKHMLEFYQPKEWMDFIQKLSNIIRTLLSKALLGDDVELKTECQEVLVLLDNSDKSQAQRYSNLISKLLKFFQKHKVYTDQLPQ